MALSRNNSDGENERNKADESRETCLLAGTTFALGGILSLFT